jgi:hypothetical protein
MQQSEKKFEYFTWPTARQGKQNQDQDLACTCICPVTYQGYADNLERKIFRLRCSDNSEKNILTTSLLTSSTTSMPIAACYARGFAVVHSRAYGNARGLHIKSPQSAKNHSQDLRFRRH